MTADPLYRTGPALVIADTLTAMTGFDVRVDTDLGTAACHIDHGRELIRIQPGLSLDLYHLALSRAWRRVMFGPESAPQFRLSPREMLTAGCVPAQRARDDGRVVCMHCRVPIGPG